MSARYRYTLQAVHLSGHGMIPQWFPSLGCNNWAQVTVRRNAAGLQYCPIVITREYIGWQ